MKTILLLILVMVTSFASYAQGGLKNKTNCALRLIPVCYTPAGGGTCSGAPCGPGVLIPPQSSLFPLPGCTSACMDPNGGYIIMYDASTGCNMSATVGNPGNPCPPFGTSTTLPACPGCGGLMLTVTYIGNDIQIED